MSQFCDLRKRNIKIIDYLSVTSSNYDYFFIKDGKMLREVFIEKGKKVGQPISPTKESFIQNGYEEILNEYISYIRYIPETKLYNVFIGE